MPGAALDRAARVDLRCRARPRSYVAPEILLKEPYDYAVDMWSVGVVCFLLLSGDLPFEEGIEITPGSNSGLMAMYEDIKSATYTMREADWKLVSAEARQLTAQLLMADPNQRCVRELEPLAIASCRRCRSRACAGSRLSARSPHLGLRRTRRACARRVCATLLHACHA